MLLTCTQHASSSSHAAPCKAAAASLLLPSCSSKLIQDIPLICSQMSICLNYHMLHLSNCCFAMQCFCSRGQCTHMLEDLDTMKAHAGLHSTYNDSPAKGRPLLPATVQAEKLVMQLIGWAAQMPLFATLITGQYHCYLLKSTLSAVHIAASCMLPLIGIC